MQVVWLQQNNLNLELVHVISFFFLIDLFSPFWFWATDLKHDHTVEWFHLEKVRKVVLYSFIYLFLLLVTKNIELNEKLFHSDNLFSLMETEWFQVILDSNRFDIHWTTQVIFIPLAFVSIAKNPFPAQIYVRDNNLCLVTFHY